MSFRIGPGYALHRFAEGRRLVLGGVEIPSDVGLDGFSDADVLLHALSDAILGAAGLGDIGEHFPPGDERWRDADSAVLLERVLDIDGQQGLEIVNCDLTLIGERPKLAPYRDRVRQRIAEILDIPVGRVGLKATTNEKRGAGVLAEGVAALAAVLLAEVPDPE